MNAIEKEQIRRALAEKKQLFTREELGEYSAKLWLSLESHPLFRRASTILLYHSLPDEVCTHPFIEKWSKRKRIILPVVKGDDLELREYTGNNHLREGRFHIAEPDGAAIEDEQDIDLAFIPGVSFDCMGHRLGRGKGYYDRLLSRLDVYKIGVCFSFQISDRPLPTEPHDVCMDEVWTEEKNYPRNEDV